MKKFLDDIPLLSEMKTNKNVLSMQVEEYPFDAQVLSASPLYRKSRKLYTELGGSYLPRACSTMRSLMSTDLFKDEIEYTPCETELLWLHAHHRELHDPKDLLDALAALSGISLFHEQNHRIVWRLLPNVPTDQAGTIRYLNFIESLVVTLDLALGDEVGAERSLALERLKVIYRPAGSDKWTRSKNEEYRQYLRTLFYVTYLLISLVDVRDIAKCVEYVFPNQKQMNRVAVRRGLDLSELFTQTTNREWQKRYWKQAQTSLLKLQKKRGGDEFEIVEDPLDLENEFAVVDRVLDAFHL